MIARYDKDGPCSRIRPPSGSDPDQRIHLGTRFNEEHSQVLWICVFVDHVERVSDCRLNLRLVLCRAG